MPTLPNTHELDKFPNTLSLSFLIYKIGMVSVERAIVQIKRNNVAEEVSTIPSTQETPYKL